jgi:excisionase family DNA binding protein
VSERPSVNETIIGVPRLLLRPSEAAEALGISRSRAYELIASGGLPSVRVGGSVRVPVAALERWITERLGDTSVR